MLWRTSSTIMATTILGSAALTIGPALRFRADKNQSYSPWVLASVAVGGIAIFALQVFNALAVFWTPGAGPFSLGLVYFLATGVVQFVRILFVRSV